MLCTTFSADFSKLPFLFPFYLTFNGQRRNSPLC